MRQGRDAAPPAGSECGADGTGTRGGPRDTRAQHQNRGRSRRPCPDGVAGRCHREGDPGLWWRGGRASRGGAGVGQGPRTGRSRDGQGRPRLSTRQPSQRRRASAKGPGAVRRGEGTQVASGRAPTVAAPGGPSLAGEARGDSCPAALGGWSGRHPLPGTDPRPGRPEGEQGCGVNHTVHTYHQGTASPRTNGGVGDPLKPKSPMPQGSSLAAFQGAESRGWPWVFADTVNAAASSWAGDGRRVWPHAPSSPGWTAFPAFAVIFLGGEQQGGGGRVALPRAQESLIKSKETFELSLQLGAVLCSGRLDLPR